MSFKLTYSTMFNPPPQLHTRFEDAAARVRSKLGATHPLYIQGEDRAGADALEKRNPARRAEILGLFAAAPSAERRYTKYAIVDDEHLRYRAYGPARGRHRVLENRDIIKLFDPLRVSDSFLLQSARREILFRKPTGA